MTGTGARVGWRPRTWTLRARLTATATLLVGLTLLAAGWGLVATLESQLRSYYDETDRTRLLEILDEAARDELPDDLPRGEEGVSQVVDAEGRVLAASVNTTTSRPLSDARAGAEPELEVLSAPDDDEVEVYRTWTATLQTPQGPVTAWVGTATEAVGEASARLRSVLLMGGPLVLAALAAIVWFSVGGALGRVDRLRAQVDAVDDADLDQRVAPGGPPDEVGRLAATMNRMLARVEAGRARERRFLADVSHDLQSPLAAQRVLLDVALAEGRGLDPEETAEVLAGTAEMDRLVADLLALALLEQPRQDDPPLVDLDDLVLEEAVRARTDPAVVVDVGGVSGAVVRAHADDLRRAVRNLLDNAVSHASSRVEVLLAEDDDGVVLEVRDDGPGMDPADLERVFDRFYRGDLARARPGGTGLGLPIARALVASYGGTLVATPPDGPAGPGAGGARLVLRLPAARFSPRGR